MYQYKDIKAVHLEITQKCQAACPMCDRNENGGRDNKHLTNAELSLEDCQKIFKPEFIKQLTSLSICGNLGDPIIAKDTLEVFEYFRSHNETMWLSMNTIGGAKPGSWWRRLAPIIGQQGAVIFSVDGLSDTNHLYRQNVVWNNVERNMKAFIEAGGRTRWDFIIFGHNEHQTEEAKKLADEWGVDQFRLKKSSRFFSANDKKKPKYQAQNRKGENTQLIEMSESKINQNSALLKQESIEDTYGSMAEYYNACSIKCKVAKEKNVYITAEGLMMPCCWTAGRMYKHWQKDYRNEQIWDFIDNAGGKDSLNAIEHGLEAVMQSSLLTDIENSWNKDSIENGKLRVCAMKCGEKFDPFTTQFK